jgi:hypothetical protein
MEEYGQEVRVDDLGRPNEALSTVVTTETHSRSHASAQRGVGILPSSTFVEGRFGRMFRELPVFEHRPESLRRLAERMIVEPEPQKPAGAEDEDENPKIPAGYTYLGQFVDHDITFDPASSLQRQNDPDALHNFRTPRFDLDCIYGRGPADQPYLYRNGPEPVPLNGVRGVDLRGLQFLLGRDVGEGIPDLPRNDEERALIGDPRNDENNIVSQLHSVFLRFHNRVVEHVAKDTVLRGDDLFKEAQRLVRWHYQWVVVYDFLRRIVGADIVADVLREETYRIGGMAGEEKKIRRPHLLFYRYEREPFIPIEFSVAAYRFGHSMVRPSYFINDFVKEQRESNTPDEPRIPIFSDDLDPLANLNGFRELPDQWGFQWEFFYEMSDVDGEERVKPQLSYKIDAELVDPLGKLPESIASDVRSLAERNLLRGLRLGLPSGQSVARAMGIEPLTDEQLELGDLTRDAGDLREHAPLWYYILKEAEELGGSVRLGPVGGRIVAEVFVGLLAGDPLSFLNVEPSWRPGPPFASEHPKPPFSDEESTFGMPDLVRFATSS